jgi:Domain of unknown function (DUF4145)
MTDKELRSQVLQYFYDNRLGGQMEVRCTDVDLALGAIEFCRICKQLKELRLIEWKTPGNVVSTGIGVITAKGVNSIEQQRDQQQSKIPHPKAMTTIQCKCPECERETQHEVLAKDENVERFLVPDGDGYRMEFHISSEMVKCLGCGFVSLRKVEWNSEAEDEYGRPLAKIEQFPSLAHKSVPQWLQTAKEEQNRFVFRAFIEVFQSFASGFLWIACVGARSVLEAVMTDKIGDNGSFAANLNKFRDGGHISRQDYDRLKILMEAGHAGTHRSFEPSKEEVEVLLGLLENVVKGVYFDENKLRKIGERIPPRPDKRGPATEV